MANYELLTRSKDPKKSFLQTQKGANALFLEYVNKCSNENCPFYDRCGYIKGGLCGFEASFYIRIVNYLLSLEKRGMIGEAEFTHVSIVILPLYRQLLQLYRIECSLEGEMRIIDRDGRVTNRINPVYKEIRDVIDKIGSMWKNANISYDAKDRRLTGEDMTFNIKDNVYQFIDE